MTPSSNKIMPNYFTTLVLTLFAIQTCGQTLRPPIFLSHAQAKNESNFRKHSKELNIDSSFFYIQQFAKQQDSTSLIVLDELLYQYLVVPISIHGQEIDKDKAIDPQKKFAQQLLVRMIQDSTHILSAPARPIKFWVEIQKLKTNQLIVDSLINDFISHDLDQKAIYDNKSIRYGISCFRIISENSELQIQSDRLFNTLSKILKSELLKKTASDEIEPNERRSWLRFLNATLNTFKAKSVNDLSTKGEYLRFAFENNPDIRDMAVSYAYQTDMDFLFGGKECSFQNRYIDFLIDTDKDDPKILSILTEITLAQPHLKNQLKALYKRTNKSNNSFTSYWHDKVNSQGTASPPIELFLLNGTPILSRELADKWILVDFWGTWCGPCREEHPDLEKLYETYIVPHSEKIELITISCMDTKKKVSDYMADNNLTFPVAMSDNNIEKLFSVNSYPSKFLITPVGKLIRIPKAIDWIMFVKSYIDF